MAIDVFQMRAECRMHFVPGHLHFEVTTQASPQDVATVLEFALLADDVCRLVASIATGAPSMIFA